MNGVVFNIQHYSIHDGPGIRSTVFLKGCPLRCVWCQHPESQSRVPEVLFVAEKCEGCGACAAACAEKAITLHEGRARTDRARCTGMGRCVEACPNEARSLVGKEMSSTRDRGEGSPYPAATRSPRPTSRPPSARLRKRPGVIPL